MKHRIARALINLAQRLDDHAVMRWRTSRPIYPQYEMSVGKFTLDDDGIVKAAER